MTEKKYSFITIFTYGLVLFSPVLFQSLLKAGPSLIIQLTTLTYFLGAILMIFYRIKSKTFGLETRQKNLLITIVIGIVGIPASLILQMLILQIEQRFLGQSVASQNTQNIIQLIMNNMIFILATTIAGPIMEEFVFRRALVGIIANYSNIWIGVIVSAVAFAFAHSDNHLLVYILLGLFFSGLYALTGRIWTSMITHVGMNTLVIIIQLLVHAGYIKVP